MECAVLGELRVVADGVARRPRGRRSRDLLAALVVRAGQPVDPGVLLEQVWGEDHGLAVSVVHTQVARLRRDVGTEVVQTAPAGYRLADLPVDADRFAARLAAARKTSMPEAAVARLREALADWHGDLAYADVSPGVADAERSRLTGLRTSARELLAELLLDQGGPDAVVEAAALAETLVADEPLRERGHELAMLAAVHGGSRAAALAAYDRLRTTLRDELGIDPGPEAQDLHLRVLRGQAVTRRDETSAGRRPRPPAPTSRTVGRDADLARLLELVGERRLVSVVGLGGVGKSRVLSEVAARIDSASSAYVDLAGLPEQPGEELVEVLGEAVGITIRAHDPLESLVEGIGDRPLTLLLDEAERCLLDTSALVASLLARCPAVRVVATSRRPLGLVGEAVHLLAPLATPPEDADAETVARSPAVVLLKDRIADRAPGLVEGEDALRRLAGFTRRVDGLPLALLLLAAQAPGRSLDQLEVLLETPIALGSEDAGLPERHRSLPDTIGWSLERMPAPMLATLRRLSVFAGHFDAAAARAVVGADVGADVGDDQVVDRALRALVRDAFVQVERTDRDLSYRLLRPVRDVAHAELVASGEVDDTTGRHRRWHADRWRGLLRSDALLRDVREHYADYVQALRSAHDAADHEQVTTLSLTLGRLWSFADMTGPGLRWYGRALDAGFLTDFEQAQLRRMRAGLQIINAPEEARRDLELAIPVFAEHGSMIELVGAHLGLSQERHEAGADAEAAEHARQAVAAARDTTDERLADALGLQAGVLAETDPAGAEAAAQEAWSIVCRSGSSAAVASVACNVSWAQLEMGRPSAAVDLLDRALAGLGDDEVPMFLSLHRGWALLAHGEPAAAVTEFGRVVRIGEDAREGSRLAEVYLGAACALAAVRDPIAPELLAGAEAMLGRTRRALRPWQEVLRRRGRADASLIGPAPWGSGTLSGTALADLVMAATGPAAALS
ncbi:MAG TPA: BTAD domain-containing putative transcriptional regulator [Marmoricola sp.]